MAIKVGNLIIGSGEVGVANVAPTAPPVEEKPTIMRAEVVETPTSSVKVSQYIADIDVHNKINSLFD